MPIPEDGQQQAEKLGYLASKVEEIHADLRDHVAREESHLEKLEKRMGDSFEKMEKRVSDIEEEHKRWKGIYFLVRTVVVGAFALLTFEWQALRDLLKKLFS